MASESMELGVLNIKSSQTQSNQNGDTSILSLHRWKFIIGGITLALIISLATILPLTLKPEDFDDYDDYKIDFTSIPDFTEKPVQVKIGRPLDESDYGDFEEVGGNSKSAKLFDVRTIKNIITHTGTKI